MPPLPEDSDFPEPAHPPSSSPEGHPALGAPSQGILLAALPTRVRLPGSAAQEGALPDPRGVHIREGNPYYVDIEEERVGGDAGGEAQGKAQRLRDPKLLY